MSAVILIIIFLLWPVVSNSAMSSTNYYIYADTFDVGGGLTTSTNYSLEGTYGGEAIGVVSSTSYEMRGGYQYMERGVLSLSLSASNINFGTLTAAALATSNAVVTITTDSINGYSLSIGSVSGTSLAAVSDGAVDGDGGSEEYGIAVSGTNRSFSNDRAVTAGLVLATTSTEMTADEQITATFKIISASGSTAGSYSQTVTLTASANI
jgi:hypothetical protein